MDKKFFCPVMLQVPILFTSNIYKIRIGTIILQFFSPLIIYVYI